MTASAPGRTCFPRTSALGPSTALPRVAAEVVAAGLGRDLFLRVSRQALQPSKSLGL